jgi:hypothetical protein
MATYEQAHAGDVVLGHDNELWGIAEIAHEPQLVVTLVRYGHRVTGRPPGGTLVTIVAPADVSGEMWAVQQLIDAGLGPEIISERWES